MALYNLLERKMDTARCHPLSHTCLDWTGSSYPLGCITYWQISDTTGHRSAPGHCSCPCCQTRSTRDATYAGNTVRLSTRTHWSQYRSLFYFQNLEVTLQSLGIDQAQIQDARQIVVSHLANLANDVVPLFRSIFNFVLDFIVVAILSIYFLIDGARIIRWLRGNLPFQQRTTFLLDTFEHVVGGYIRGQFTLSFLIGLLVGVGMAILQVPHPVLLGVLAFFMAFIPVLGTFITAAACVLLALTQNNGWVFGLTHQSWVLAIIVLLYFLAVHSFESEIVGPRIVGNAVGLHPIIAISALIAGVELFGILGALFVAPVVGVLQAVIISFWKEWRVTHPEQFPTKKAVEEGDISLEPASSSGEQIE